MHYDTDRLTTAHVRTGTVGKEERSEEWLEYFDVVVTGCMKPAFFEVKKPLFEVDTATGALFNTDNGTPMIPIGESPPPLFSFRT